MRTMRSDATAGTVIPVVLWDLVSLAVAVYWKPGLNKIEQAGAIGLGRKLLEESYGLSLTYTKMVEIYHSVRPL